jgi:hypothetical protein
VWYPLEKEIEDLSEVNAILQHFDIELGCVQVVNSFSEIVNASERDGVSVETLNIITDMLPSLKKRLTQEV